MIRCEWGIHGIHQLINWCDAFVIIDVMSFCTCVDIAVACGAVVYPYGGDSAADFAQAQQAILAGRDRSAAYSLSPHSLLSLPHGSRLVLPSPNGSTLSTATGDKPTYAACLRNAPSVAQAVQEYEKIAVIPAGERWREDYSLRPALEDWIGAGAVIHHLDREKSPEAEATALTFKHYQSRLLDVFNTIPSGIELIEKGYPQDVVLASEYDVSHGVPHLVDGVFLPRK